MAGAGGQKRDVSRLEVQHPALDAAELELAVTARDTHDLVDLGMVVNEVVNGVPPGSAPPVALEQRVDHRGGIKGTPFQHDRATVNQHGIARMVRDDAV